MNRFYSCTSFFFDSKRNCPSITRATYRLPLNTHMILWPSRAFCAHCDAFLGFCSMHWYSPMLTALSLLLFKISMGYVTPSSSTDFCPVNMAFAISFAARSRSKPSSLNAFTGQGIGGECIYVFGTGIDPWLDYRDH